jgi:hypothetical protein
MFSNFLFRIRQYLYDNRRSLIRIALTLAAILMAVFLIFAAVEKIQSARYEKRVQALEKQFQDKSAESAAAQARADALKVERDAKAAQVKELQKRAEVAEQALQSIRNVNVTLKGNYETARDTPMPFTPISVIDACIQLAELGRPCQ